MHLEPWAEFRNVPALLPRRAQLGSAQGQFCPGAEPLQKGRQPTQLHVGQLDHSTCPLHQEESSAAI